MRYLLVLIVVACGSKESPTPQPHPPPAPKGDAAVSGAELPAAILQIRETKQLPAIGAGAWRDGKELFVFASGTRKATEELAVSTDDPWHLGSNTKAMTATLVGLYVDRGVMKWDDTIGTLFAGEKIHPDYAKVTIEQLLRHVGGAPANPPDPIWARAWADGEAPEARENLVRAVLAQKPAHAVGTFEYSNTGYAIAGAALERATKQTWEALVRSELFAPLGMKSCGFGAPTGDAPWGHDASGTPIAPGPKADNPPAIGPAGTVHCSLRDYGKFLAVHAGATKLLAPETLARLHRVDGGESYAGGWIVMNPSGATVLAHSGSNTMWYATTLVGVGQHTAFVLVTNKGESLDGELFSLVPLVAKAYPP